MQFGELWPFAAASRGRTFKGFAASVGLSNGSKDLLARIRFRLISPLFLVSKSRLSKKLNSTLFCFLSAPNHRQNRLPNSVGSQGFAEYFSEVESSDSTN